MCCARVTGPAWSRRPGPCSPSTSCCAWPWSTRWRPGPAPTRTGPASPPRWKPPATSSPPPRGICPDGPADLPGAIGRAVLATLLPARRPRFSARKVKCATSRYLNRDDGRPPHPAAITAIDITISTPPLDLKPGRTRRDRTPPRPRHAAAHPAGADHRHHHQPAPARLERPRTRPAPGRQAPQHAHPARRMGTAGLLHPHRLRHLPLNTPPDTPSTNPPDP